MRPDPDTLDQSPEYFRELVERIGRGTVWISRNSGISRRRLLYLSKGERTVGGIVQPVRMTYCEQFCLECLADDERDCG